MPTKVSQWLIGEVEPEICGNKLPSNRQVLKCYLYTRYTLKKSGHETKLCVYDKVMLFWDTARIKTKHRQHITEKVEKLFKEYRSVESGYKHRRDENQQKLQDDFERKLDDLFDVAHERAMDFLETEKEKNFLLSQRRSGIQGNLEIYIDSSAVKKNSSNNDTQEKVLTDVGDNWLMSNFSQNILDNENTPDKRKLKRKIDKVMEDLTSEERALAISLKSRRRSVTSCTLITADLSNYVFDDENFTELIDASEDDSDESDSEYKIYIQKPAKMPKITNADEIV